MGKGLGHGWGTRMERNGWIQEKFRRRKWQGPCRILWDAWGSRRWWNLEGSQVVQHPGLELVEAWPGLFCGSPYTHVLFQEFPVTGREEGDKPAEQTRAASRWRVDLRGLQEGDGG